jgi:hypothetical protein
MDGQAAGAIPAGHGPCGFLFFMVFTGLERPFQVFFRREIKGCCMPR